MTGRFFRWNSPARVKQWGRFAAKGMGKILLTTTLSVFCAAIMFCGSAHSAGTPKISESAQVLDSSNERNPLRYHLVTVPSTNRHRVNAMSLQFLSLIPRAKLIPKTEENTVYRLVANTYDTIGPARKRVKELSHACESPFVTTEESGYAVIAGSQLTEALALAEKERLAAKNIPTEIYELRVPLRKWQMKSSESFSVREAVTLAGKLSKCGVITTLEPAINSFLLELSTP